MNVILAPVDIDAFDAFQSCDIAGCREYGSLRVIVTGHSPRLMCYTHAHRLEHLLNPPRRPTFGTRCDSCDRLVENRNDRCATCGRPTRQVLLDDTGAPLWLADGGWYD